MIFLNPSILWALFAILIPIIVHFFNFQRPKRVLFSNIDFVKEVNKAVVRNIRLKQWLLLFIRILAITFLVLAIAQPTIKNENQSSQNLGNHSVAIVLDNSMSMKAENSKGSYFNQIKQNSRTIIDSYSKSDEFLIFPLSKIRLNAIFQNKNNAKSELSKIEKTYDSPSLKKLLEFYDEIFSKARNTNKILYFLSDFQRNSVLADSINKELVAQNAQIYLLPVKQKPQNNVYFSDFKIENKILEKNKSINISVKIHNDGNEKLENVELKLSVEEKTLAKKVIQLEANNTQTVELSFSMQKSGWFSGKISVDDSPIDFDNDYYFSFNIPEKLKVLLVSHDKNKYLNTAFSEVFKTFKTKEISDKRLSQESLETYDVLVLNGVNEISSGLAERLKNYLKNDGGILFFPDENMKNASINGFYTNLGLGKFTEVQTFETAQDANNIRLDHRIFDGVFEKIIAKAKVDAPKIKKIYNFQKNPQKSSNTILSVGNNPVLLEQNFMKGTLFTFCIAPDAQWSDFPLKSIFVPILHRAAFLAGSKVSENSNFTLNKTQSKSIQNADGESEITLENGDEKIVPHQYVQDGNLYIKLGNNELSAGNYFVKQNGKTIEKLSVNLADKESKLEFMNSTDLKKYFEQKGLSKQVKVLESDSELLQKTISNIRKGIPLWRWFILATLLMLTAEVLVVRFL